MGLRREMKLGKDQVATIEADSLTYIQALGGWISTIRTENIPTIMLVN
jgi:hypothetical protein